MQLKDPQVQLAEVKRVYAIRHTITLLTVGLLIFIDFRQSSLLERDNIQLLADSHAIQNLMEADQRLKEVANQLELCSTLKIQPPPAPTCHKDGDLLVCDTSSTDPDDYALHLHNLP